MSYGWKERGVVGGKDGAMEGGVELWREGERAGWLDLW